MSQGISAICSNVLSNGILEPPASVGHSRWDGQDLLKGTVFGGEECWSTVTVNSLAHVCVGKVIRNLLSQAHEQTCREFCHPSRVIGFESGDLLLRNAFYHNVDRRLANFRGTDWPAWSLLPKSSAVQHTMAWSQPSSQGAVAPHTSNEPPYPEYQCTTVSTHFTWWPC